MSNVSNKKVGFLVHPRGFKDFYKKFPYAKIIPDSLLEKITSYMSPVKVSKITGLSKPSGQQIPGYVLSLPLTASQILENRDLARDLIKESVKLADRLDIGILSLGGLTASISKGGKDVASLNQVGITTGRAYTVKNITDYVEQLVKAYNLPKRKLRIGIVGAAGSIGSGVAIKLEQHGFRNFILIDLERKLQKLHRKMSRLSSDSKIRITHQLNKLRETDFIITATSAPEALVRRKDITSGTFVIDDAQPSDISDNIYKMDDTVVLEAGAVKTPGVKSNIDMGLQSKEENFCCLAESLILAQNDYFKNFSIGHLSLDNIDTIKTMEQHLNYRPADPQNKHGYISIQKITNVAQMLYDRFN